jgi:hypothetical protein
MKKEKSLICLAPNFPSYKQDCVEQCEDCKKFQYNLENPVKVSKEEREKIQKTYEAIIKKSKI